MLLDECGQGRVKKYPIEREREREILTKATELGLFASDKALVCWVLVVSVCPSVHTPFPSLPLTLSPPTTQNNFNAKRIVALRRHTTVTMLFCF